MKKIQFLIVVLLYTFFSATGFAAELIELKGKVVDAETQQPLPGASILIPDLRVSVMTNESGEFTLKNVPARGSFLVQIRYVGYQTITQIVDFKNVGSMEFALKSSVIEGREVVITGSANSSDNKKIAPL
ncbi:carboxypeptidase-like regulatory domain-containing protein [Pedobacter panaciterrae]